MAIRFQKHQERMNAEREFAYSFIDGSASSYAGGGGGGGGFRRGGGRGRGGGGGFRGRRY